MPQTSVTRRPAGVPAAVPGLGTAPLAARLVRLGLIEPPPAAPSFMDGLGRWLGWTEAIALADALLLSAATAGGDGAEAAARAAADLAAVRHVLEVTIDDDAETAADVDFAPHRRRCQAVQQAMAADIAALRARLRQGLAQGVAARLAAIDAVFERTLAPREQSLLALMPTLLERRFLQHQAAAGDAAGAAPWLAAFRRDMRQLLRDELALRLQPCAGLVQALHAA
jgi:hypothetical protein